MATPPPPRSNLWTTTSCQRLRKESRCGGACTRWPRATGGSRSSRAAKTARPAQVSRYFRGTKRQAQGALAKLVTEVEQQQVTSAGTGKVAELLDRWLDYITPNRAAYTID